MKQAKFKPTLSKMLMSLSSALLFSGASFAAQNMSTTYYAPNGATCATV